MIPTAIKLKGGLKIGDFEAQIKDLEANQHFLSLEAKIDNFSSNTFLNMISYIALGKNCPEIRFELLSLKKLDLNLKLYPNNISKSKLEFQLSRLKICNILKVNEISAKVNN